MRTVSVSDVTRVKVGAWDYTVSDYPQGEAATVARFGECCANRKQIKIDRHWPEAQQAATLLHEIMHAIYHEQGIDDKDDEERIVSAISNGLFTLMRDNQGLMAKIEEPLRKHGNERQRST